MAPFPGVTSQQPGGGLTTLVHLLPLLKGPHFILTETNTYSGYGSAFTVHNAFTIITNCELTECLIHH